jgi:pyridoxal phosphate enzyme (YggS family)
MSSAGGFTVRRLERIERLSDDETPAFERRVANNLRAVRERISRALASAGRRPETVAVLAVTKGFGPEAVTAAIASGLTDVGENYLQEAAAKFAALEPHSVAAARRHFIGRLQRNKCKRIVELFDVVQSVDDLAIAKALDQAAREIGKKLDVLVQLNIASDDRAGVSPGEAAAFASVVRDLPNLTLRGMMAVGPADSANISGAFARAHATFTSLRDAFDGQPILSLGMTGDLEAAVAAGSTMVRLGTALFGERPVKQVSTPDGGEG